MSNLEQAEEGTLSKRSNGVSHNGAQVSVAPASSSAKSKPKADNSSSRGWLPLAAVVSLQLLFIFNFEFSASRLQRDLDLSQERVRTLQTRLAAVEHSALKCYGKLNATELRVVHESRIINDETRELRNLTRREHEEDLELRALRATVSDLNMSLVKNKITLRYEMEERLAAEKAAQASQNSVQVIKDQLQNANDEVKALKERFHRETAKTQKKLSKAERKAKDEEKQRQKYMEGMINLQSKLGHTKSMLHSAALSAADKQAAQHGAAAEPEEDEEDEDEDAEDPLIPV